MSTEPPPLPGEEHQGPESGVPTGQPGGRGPAQSSAPPGASPAQGPPEEKSQLDLEGPQERKLPSAEGLDEGPEAAPEEKRRNLLGERKQVMTVGAGHSYVAGHGSSSGGQQTFVPAGLEVQFFTEEGHASEKGIVVAWLLGLGGSLPAIMKPGARIENYILAPNSNDERMSLLALFYATSQATLLFIGDSPLAGVSTLCSDAEKCDAQRSIFSSRAVHRKECTGLFAPRYAPFLRQRVHLLNCRGFQVPKQPDFPPESEKAYQKLKELIEAGRPREAREAAELWETLSYDTQLTLIPYQPVTDWYRSREARTGIASRPGDERAFREAITRLAETAAAVMARVASSPEPDTVERRQMRENLRSSCSTISKVCGTFLRAVEEAQRFEEKKMPSGAPRRDPLSGISILRSGFQEFQAVSEIVLATPKKFGSDADLWRELAEAVHGFLTDKNISRMIGKDFMTSAAGVFVGLRE